MDDIMNGPSYSMGRIVGYLPPVSEARPDQTTITDFVKVTTS